MDAIACNRQRLEQSHLMLCLERLRCLQTCKSVCLRMEFKDSY